MWKRLAGSLLSAVAAASVAAPVGYHELRKVEIVVASRAVLGQVAAAGVDLTEVERVGRGGVVEAIRVIADPSLREALSRNGIAFEELAWRAQDPWAQAENTQVGYMTFGQLVSNLQAAATANPTLATLSSIGPTWQTVQGTASRQLWAMRVRGNPGGPEVLFHGCHHAREMASVEIPYFFLQHLLSSYATDPLVNYLVDHRDVWIVPCVNPDGRVEVEQGGAGAGCWQRKNMDSASGPCPANPGVDPNRNYGFQWGGCGTTPTPCSEVFPGPAPASEPEIQAMQGFMQSRGFAAAVGYHSYVSMMLWPWGYTTATPTANFAFGSVGRRMAELANRTPNPCATYVAGPIASTIYCASGGTDDWAYAQKGIMHFTIELDGGSTCDFWPPYASVAGPMWNRMRPVAVYLVNIADAPWTRGFGAYADPLTIGVSPNPSSGAASVTLSCLLDNATNAAPVNAAQYWVDTLGPDGTGTAMTGAFGSQAVAAAAAVPVGGLSPGQHRVFVRGFGGAGQWGSLAAAWFVVSAASPTATATVTATHTRTACRTATSTVSFTATLTCTRSATRTATVSASRTATPSATPAPFAVVPNPAPASARAIRITGVAPGQRVRIYAVSGELVATLRAAGEPAEAVWEPRGAAAGLYVVRAGPRSRVLALTR